MPVPPSRLAQIRRSPEGLLLLRLALALAVYSAVRLVFFVNHRGVFAGSDPAELVSAFLHGLRFDLSAIAYTNIPFNLLSLAPAAWLARAGYQRLLTAAVARELAVREGLKATLEGDVTRLGSGWVVAARIVAAERGEPLATFRERADDESELMGAVDRLSQSIREKVGEKLSLARAGEPLEAVTTSSLKALRAGVRAARSAG